MEPSGLPTSMGLRVKALFSEGHSVLDQMYLGFSSMRAHPWIPGFEPPNLRDSDIFLYLLPDKVLG